MAESKPKFTFGAGGAGRVVPQDCEIQVPMEDGKAQTQILTARFELMGEEKLRSVHLEQGDKGLLGSVLKGFVDLPVDGGGTVRDKDAIAALLDLPYVVVGLVKGYYALVSGRQVKN